MPSISLDDTLITLGDLARYRGHVSDELDAFGLDTETVDDVVLILSELLTNAFTHGRATEADVHVTADEQCIDMSVSHPRTTSVDLPLSPTAMPATDNPAGRGLPIVDSLATDRTTTVTSDRVRVTCRILRPLAT